MEVINEYRKKIEDTAEQIKNILREEYEERELRLAERDLHKVISFYLFIYLFIYLFLFFIYYFIYFYFYYLLFIFI